MGHISTVRKAYKVGPAWIEFGCGGIFLHTIDLKRSEFPETAIQHNPSKSINKNQYIYIYKDRYVYKYQTSATPESKLSLYPTFNLAVKDLYSLDSCFEASDWEKRYEFVWALDSDIDLSKAVTCGDRRVRRVVSLDWPLRDGSGGFAPIPGDCAADGCTHCWTNLCQSLNQTQVVVMRKMEKIDVFRSWNQFCWLIVCWFMGVEYLRVWRVSHLVEVHKGGASLVQMQDLVILNHLRHNCFHKNDRVAETTDYRWHAGALQDSSASVIRREGHSPTRHHSHHGHQVSGTELNGLNVKASADLIFHLRYDFIPRSQWDADTGSRRHWTFQDGMVVDSCDMSWCLGCDFRHTDFVELTAPLLKSAVLRGIELRRHKIPHVPRSFWKRQNKFRGT